MDGRGASVRSPIRRALLATAVAGWGLAGCGFQLRGAAKFPFSTIHVPSNHAMLVELARNINAASNAKVVADPKDAAAIFTLQGEVRDKVILSVGTGGRVREYQLRYGITFRVHDGKGGDYVPSNVIALRRDVSFNDQVLAKESEEALLFREMQTDVVQQIIRRLQASRLRTADDD